MISLIAAVNNKGVLGKDGTIPWVCKEDLKFFKKQTLGSTLVMGRKTYESLPGELPGRKNVVVSRDALSLEDAIDGEDNVFIIGGGEIYKYALEHEIPDKVIINYIDDDSDGDVIFPIEILKRYYSQTDENKTIFYRTVIYEKLSKSS